MQGTAGELADRSDREIVGGGTEATGCDDQVDALVGEELQLRREVGGAVAADGDVCDVDAELQRLIGDPRTVTVGDPSTQDFGSGDDDSRACAHPFEATSSHRPPPGSHSPTSFISTPDTEPHFLALIRRTSSSHDRSSTTWN